MTRLRKCRLSKRIPIKVVIKINSFNHIKMVYARIEEIVKEMKKINPYVDVTIEVDTRNNINPLVSIYQ